MEKNKPTSMILDDTSILSDICGVNDYNLLILSRLLSEKVYVRGNEIFLDSEDEEKQSLFCSILCQLAESIKEGIPASPDLIIAIHASLSPLGEPKSSQLSCKDLFKNSAIEIPGSFSRVYPRTSNQALFLQGLSTHDICFAVGPAGTGKTYLAVAWALYEILSRRRRKLVLTRPVVEAGESLGYLPGDLGQKISPYLRPLYDAMEALIPFETIRRLEDNHTIEIAPLAYMRGRSLNNSVVILDEAQNTTKEQMKMFLTRLGEGSVAVITGDLTQVDLPKRMESGLMHVIPLLNNIDGIFICKLDGRDVVRNPLVRKIIEAYESAS